jgi:hypothetical protein
MSAGVRIVPDGIYRNKLMYYFIEHDSDEAYRVLRLWTISILDIESTV